jgi:carbon storage regulator
MPRWDALSASETPPTIEFASKAARVEIAPASPPAEGRRRVAAATFFTAQLQAALALYDAGAKPASRLFVIGRESGLIINCLPPSGYLRLSDAGRRGGAKERFMLVLSRRKNESIVINEDITIVVVEIRGDKVRLGIEAPKEMPVHRNEVYEALRRNMRLTHDEPYVPTAHTDHEWPAGCGSELAEAPAVAVAEPQSPPHDGLCCPQCRSDDVRIERIKVAYQGAELVRWRECNACGNRFQTLEKVHDL